NQCHDALGALSRRRCSSTCFLSPCDSSNLSASCVPSACLRPRANLTSEEEGHKQRSSGDNSPLFTVEPGGFLRLESD
ncbi:unnamed protein product, partial [Ectocarpus sp. 4 AP-2014]